MTGHEHEAEFSERIVSVTGDRSRYIEGAVLQTDEKWQSGFNIVNIDIENEKWKCGEYKWAQGKQRYGCEATTDWEPFLRSSNLKQLEFEPSQDFARFLSDAGAGFTHPQAATVNLRDIFVFPDMDLRPIEGDSERVLLGDSFMNYLLQHPRLFIAAGERFGKTTLAKSIYRHALEHGLVPIYVSGELINSWAQKDFLNLIRRHVAKQYGESRQEKYDQQPIDSRLLIIDDFHSIPLNRKGRNLLLGTITKLYPKTILLGDELFFLQELPRKNDESESMLSFRSCHLRQFGHERRAKLIERWCSIGKEFTVEEEEIATEVAKKEKVIDTLLGKNLMPSIPIVVLSMLQSLEARENLTTASGTYGYIYEVLITAQLSRMKKLTLDTKYTWLSCLAYKLFKNGKRAMSKAELDEVNTQYCDLYKMRIAIDVLISELEQCSMLRNIDGLYRFQHKYSYYYFVAKYFQDNMQSDVQAATLREEITRLANQLYNEDSANILIFYIYLTKDLLIIKEMLLNTKRIFSEHEPCDMDSSIQFLLVATKGAPKLEYVATDPKESKGKYLRALDSSEKEDEEEEVSIIPGEKELNDVLKINVAFKTIQIMGQILRNFPGSLKGTVKYEIAKETYLLGMRCIGMIMKALQTDADLLKSFVRNYLKEKKGITDVKDLNRQADEFLFWFGVVLGGSIIERISYSVGSDKLEETYIDLTKGKKPLGLRLVDISIKLEHFTLPTVEITDLNKELKKNIYAQTILKTRVLHHFYLYYVKPKVRDQICSKLEIGVRPEAYERASKK